MRKESIKSFLTVFLLFTSLTVLAQERQARAVEKLGFQLTAIQSDSTTRQAEYLYYLGAQADRKTISQIQQVYVKVFAEQSRNHVYGKVFTLKDLQDRNTRGDAATKRVALTSDNIDLEFGPFPPGDYQVEIRVVDQARISHIDVHKVTITDDRERKEG